MQKYDPIRHQLDEIVMLLHEGLAESEIAERVGVSFAQWQDYKSKNPDFDQEVKGIRQRYTERVHEAIWKLALGAKTVERTRTERRLPDGTVEVVEVETQREHAPDLDACVKMLDIIAHARCGVDVRPASKRTRKADASMMRRFGGAGDAG